MMMITKDPIFEELVTGKSVAIVGPSPHLLGKGVGEAIDSCDVVCRVNDIVEKKFGEDYGYKNDIIFHTCPTTWMDNFAYKLEQDEETTSNIKMVVCPSIKATHDGKGDVVENFNKINKYDIPFWWIGYENYYHFFREIGVEPNSGIRAIIILLTYPIKSLLITGFSFYDQFPEREVYADCYYNGDEYTPLVPFAPTSNPLGGHPQPPQMLYLKHALLKRHGDKITVDSFLDKRLDLNHQNVLGLE
jgi:hypothetical protein